VSIIHTIATFVAYQLELFIVTKVIQKTTSLQTYVLL